VFLALETSTLTLSLALYEREGDDVRILEQREEGPPRKVSEMLPRAVFDLLESHGQTLRGLQGISFGIGPGSFTGLRIGLATVKALAYAAQLPVGSVSSLAAAALEGEEGALLIPCEVARRGELYFGRFRRKGQQVTAEGAEDAGTVAQFAELLRETPDAVAMGPGVVAYRAELEAAGVDAARLRDVPHHPTASAVARLCQVPTTFDQQALFALEPHYVRASEPERNPKFPPLPGAPTQARIRED
jgi:tRNA threonylcarbamoyladenosine biosynthesis protein TsaB